MAGAPTLTATATPQPSDTLATLVSQRGTTGAALSTGAARTLLQLSASHGGVAIDPDDDTLYVSDTDNHRVLRIDPSGAVRVVAGTGKAGRGGNGPA
ncbi:MAG: hypothetical protein FJ306_16260, partial [Planctomycetes bacterium]|nr:hypothetical protein [Planctomycetota bacterium]